MVVYRFALRPRWILMHLLVLALVVTMVNLMLWQIRRLHDRQATNRKVEQASRLAPVALDEMTSAVAEEGATAMRYRRVAFAGTYDPEHEVTIANRSFEGAPGRWVATPLVPSGGGPAVLVVRGWVPLSVGQDDLRPVKGIEPPSGEVIVEGYVDPAQTRGRFGPTDPPTGTLAELARVDVARIAKQTGPMSKDFFVQLVAQEPMAPEAPSPVPPPPPDEGPHRGYAGQWAIFTLIAVLGYPVLLRRKAHSLREAPPALV